MTTIPLKQPSLDKRKYLHVTIDGQLDVLLISDPETDKASAAMDVHVGQLCDGDFPGIAHFCEHMLFIGTEKYQELANYYLFAGTSPMTAQEILKVLSAGGCWHLLQRCLFVYLIEN